jgi:hypothetical protein
MKRGRALYFIFYMLNTFLFFGTGTFSLKDTISKLENELNLKILCNKTVESSWSELSYDSCGSGEITIDYLQLLRKEYQSIRNILKVSSGEAASNTSFS